MSDHKSIIMALTEIGGVGPKTFQQLLMRFGPPENFVSVTVSDLEDIPRVGENGSQRILRSLDKVDHFQDKLDNYTDIGIGITTYLDDDYPAILREIDDPPPILYMKGSRDALALDYIALVGTTQATQDGLRLAIDLARGLVSRGYGIVSGLASGIDSAAHIGAIKAGGSTIAILGCGVLNIYPEENTPLADNIAERGLLVSEYDPFRSVKAARLILRNRLISAFSKAVVVVQIGMERRGELRTAHYASKQARPVFFADPDGILDPETIARNNALTIKGVESIDEIVKYMV
jgi:DNA processing protein